MIIPFYLCETFMPLCDYLYNSLVLFYLKTVKLNKYIHFLS